MHIKALIADDDMNVHQLIYDILEMNFRDIKIERALTLPSFWTKIVADENGDNPWDLVLISLEYVKEEPREFLHAIKSVNLEVISKIVIVGRESDFNACGDDIKRLPFWAKPFSLDIFEEIVKSIRPA